jgi:hypothetical protein
VLRSGGAIKPLKHAATALGAQDGAGSERCALRRKQELMLIDVDMFDADVSMATVTEPPRYID